MTWVRKPLLFRVVGKDFLASSQFLQQQATHSWERGNSRTKCGAAFQKGETYHKWGECTNASAPNTHLFSSSDFSLEKHVLYAVNLREAITSVNIGKFTVEKELLNLGNVGYLTKIPTSLNTREVTLEVGLMSVWTVGNHLPSTSTSLHIGEFT